MDSVPPKLRMPPPRAPLVTHLKDDVLREVVPGQSQVTSIVENAASLVGGVAVSERQAADAHVLAGPDFKDATGIVAADSEGDVPGPLMVVLLVMSNSPLVRTMAPCRPLAKSITEPGIGVGICTAMASEPSRRCR